MGCIFDQKILLRKTAQLGAQVQKQTRAFHPKTTGLFWQVFVIVL